MVARAQAFRLNTARLWRDYNVSLKTQPVATKSLSCMTAYAIGDIIAQLSSSKGRRFDHRLASIDGMRTARLALYGALWTGPAGHTFYRWLDKVLLPHAPQHALAIAGKVAVDQLIYAPISTIVFFAWLNIAKLTPGNTVPEVASKLLPSTLASWSLWVPAMSVNMAIVPAELRMLFINAMCVVWINVLSKMTSDVEPAVPELMLAEQPMPVSGQPPIDRSLIANLIIPQGTRGHVSLSAEYHPSFLDDWPLIDPLHTNGVASLASIITSVLPNASVAAIEDYDGSMSLMDDGTDSAHHTGTLPAYSVEDCCSLEI